MSARAGIIGYPLGHTISPAFQNAAFRHLRIDAVYEAWPTPESALARQVRGLCEPGTLGSNVTIPYKQAVMPLLDKVHPSARRIGAVNTIVNHNGKLTGHNTDAEGFIRSLRQQARFDPANKLALLFGAGGAAYAVAFALADAGAARIIILNRNLDRAQDLAEAVRQRSHAVAEAARISITPEVAAFDQPDIVVNCTSIGMRGGPDETGIPGGGHFVTRETLVCDLVYNPEETPLLRWARGLGAPTLGGLGMLVYQGAAAFELWTGQPAPADVMYAAARHALSAATR